MGIFLQLVSHDEQFYKNATRTPIIINDVSESTEGDKESFNRMIYTKYSTDLLTNLPACECLEIVGEYNLGVMCKNCGTPVQAVLEQNLEPLVWLRAPKGVTALINPIVWNMLTRNFTKSGFDIIRWICDTTYRPTVKTPPVMESVYDLGITRGYNNFVENFDVITTQLFNLKGMKTKKGVSESLQQLLRDQRHCVFSNFLPLPNRALLVIEETNVGTYRDPVIDGAVDAIRNMVSIDSELSSHNLRVRENKTIKTIAQLAEFYDDLYRATLAKKEGIFRKHIFGTRSHFSFRAVISSLTGAHDYDELHIPWGIGISVFRIHLLNKLLRRGYNPNSSISFLNEYAQRHHPLLDELFQLLIHEAPGSKISCVLQRNPSLERG